MIKTKVSLSTPPLPWRAVSDVKAASALLSFFSLWKSISSSAEASIVYYASLIAHWVEKKIKPPFWMPATKDMRLEERSGRVVFGVERKRSSKKKREYLKRKTLKEKWRALKQSVREEMWSRWVAEDGKREKGEEGSVALVASKASANQLSYQQLLIMAVWVSHTSTGGLHAWAASASTH